jgi:hypothetical protein
MYLHFWVMGVLALLMALGLFYRVAAPLFYLAFTYVFLLDKAYYLNHFYLIVLLSFLLCLIPAHRTASLDGWLFFRRQAASVPRWSVFLLRAQVFIVYFYAGLAKLSPDWLAGEPVRMRLAERTGFPAGNHFTSEWVVFAFAYGGLLFDLGIGFLLVWRRTRLVAFGLAAVFHLLNAHLFQIGIIPALAFGMTLIFAAPDMVLQYAHHLAERRSGLCQASLYTCRSRGPMRGTVPAVDGGRLLVIASPALGRNSLNQAYGYEFRPELSLK